MESGAQAALDLLSHRYGPWDPSPTTHTNIIQGVIQDKSVKISITYIQPQDPLL